MNRKRILPLILIFTLIITILTACSSNAEDGGSDSKGSSSRPNVELTPNMVGSRTPDFRELVSEMYELNDHTAGWLYIPGAEIDDVVVHYEGDNQYYYRRNFDREDEFNGVLYADRRSVFGDGTRDGIGTNICIYGHAMTDNPEGRRYSIMFGPLHDFRDPEKAEDMPYIFFSTQAEQLAFEVFAVFVVNTDQRGIPYNFEPEDQKEFARMVREEILPRSKYNYNIEIRDTDKFITLSTCIYTLDNGISSNYPNTYYRYAVMGRLVDPTEPRRERADFTINDDVIIDPDGKIDSP